MSSFSLAATYRNTGVWTVTGDLSLSIFPKNTSYAVVTGDITGNIYFRNTGAATLSGTMANVASGPFANYGGAAVALSLYRNQKGIVTFSGTIGSNVLSGTGTLSGKGIASISGDVPAGFNPTSLGNLALWLDASTMGLADGTLITAWSDGSGNSNNASASGTQRPTYKTGIINGKGVVRFNGGANCMFVTDVAALRLLGDFTIYVVASTAGNTGLLLDKIGPGGSFFGWSFGIGIAGTPGNNGKLQFYTNGGSWRTLVNPQANDSIAHILQANRSGTGLKEGIDATLSGSTVNTTTTVSNNLAIGTLTVTPGTQSFNGDMAEIIIYTAFLTPTQDSQIKAYLKAKWGTP